MVQRQGTDQAGGHLHAQQQFEGRVALPLPIAIAVPQLAQGLGQDNRGTILDADTRKLRQDGDGERGGDQELLHGGGQHGLQQGGGLGRKALIQARRADLHIQGGGGLGHLIQGGGGVGQIGEDERLDNVGAAQFGVALDKAGLAFELLGHAGQHVLHGAGDLGYHGWHGNAPVTLAGIIHR
ncbi:MAG: hypothetical protein KatS3mg057_1570 [Herpetosiphonaceae bacterium]|nr:MAG: hypothetical protein KatS3mg057_1570 [Herpetosiphonaceae bacterium]